MTSAILLSFVNPKSWLISSRQLVQSPVLLYVRLSVHLSVRLSVTLRYCSGRIRWLTSKVIICLIGLGFSLLEDPTSAI